MALKDFGQRHGSTLRSTADRLGVSRSTLSQWCVDAAAGELEAKMLGRPLASLTATQREETLWTLKSLGPRASLARLADVSPKAPRAAQRDLKLRVRYAWHRRRRTRQAVLTWRAPGAVWACDFTDPDETVVGGATAVFVVRDLASGNTLVSEPLGEASASEVVRVLRRIFAQQGSPLVLKSDNGSALVSWEVDLLLAVHGTLHLRSPVRAPRYNGACEAGIGSLKVQADHIAAQHGRVDEWSCDDIEAARRACNALAWAPCDRSRSAEEVWRTRERPSDAERSALHARYRFHAARECALRGFAAAHAIDPNEQASIDRAALGRAVVEVGILEVRWRSISPPI
ncbi:MAG: transposase family protein [Sandaracinaceae bacterium]|nr:transposase family protein [Sandaracinaceae bacterium]